MSGITQELKSVIPEFKLIFQTHTDEYAEQAAFLIIVRTLRVVPRAVRHSSPDNPTLLAITTAYLVIAWIGATYVSAKRASAKS